MPSLTRLAGRSISALPGGPRLLRHLAGATSGRQAPVFMLHRVLPDPSQCYDPEMVVSLAAFEAFLSWVAESYEVVPLEGLPARLAHGSTGAKPLCALTFDDGWMDTFVHAFPLLRDRQLPATVFLPLRFIGAQRRFWQERLYYQLRRLREQEDAEARLQAVGATFAWCPDLTALDLGFSRLRAQLVRRSSMEAEDFVERLSEAAGAAPELTGRAFMSWEEVHIMHAAGIAFGSHTLNHALLSCANPAQAEEELHRSRRELNERLDTEVKTFSYPWGGLSPLSLGQVQAAGYVGAVTTRPGLTQAGTNPWLLPRIALSDPQLGWHVHLPFRPATLQVHLARARRSSMRSITVGAHHPSEGEDPRPFRIGFIVDNADAWSDSPQSHLGGSELQLRRILEALDRRFFGPELYFLREPAGGMPRHLAWPGFSAAANGAGHWATLQGLRRLLRQRRPAMIQSMFWDGTLIGVPAAWMAGIPAILCARRNAGHWKRWQDRWALSLINRMADAWQTNSASVFKLLQTEEGIEPRAIEILPNWIDLTRCRPATSNENRAARRALKLPQDALIVVSVANYRPIKDLGTLIAAAARIDRSVPTHFVLVGEGPERDTLAAAIRTHGLEGRVALAGESSSVELYLAAADVGVLPSRSEGCSNAVLEYMAAGLPTVLSDIPANRALVTEGLFPVGDADAAAAALLELATDPALRDRRGRANRLRAEQYGGDAFAERVQSHYLRAAGGVGHAGWPGRIPPQH